MSKSTLSSVVSTLVRASMGTSVSSTIPDEDLDKHVADIILKEAKQKAENYNTLGIKAYLPAGPDPNAPRPNKRFLSSIIRSTDDHNKTILRAQALAAQEIKKEREEQERKERRARAEEAAAAEQSRRRRRRDDDDEWDTWTARDRGRSRPRLRAWDSDWRRELSEDEFAREREHRRTRRRHRSPSASQDDGCERDRRHKSRGRTPSQEQDTDKEASRRSERGRRKHRRHKRGDDDNHRRRRRTSRSPNPGQSQRVTSHKRSRSPALSEDPGSQGKKPALDITPRKISTPSRRTPVEGDTVTVDTVFRRTPKGKERDVNGTILPVSPPRVRSPSAPPPPPPRRPRGLPASSTSVRSPSVSPPPLPPAALPSKMDKYFEDSYDPRLDMTSLSVPTVPKTGFVDDSEFAAWDAMLELLRQRREDKEEKKRLEKLGFNTSDKKIPTSKLKKYSEGGDSIMDIEYKKKGSVREWDLGKEGF